MTGNGTVSHPYFEKCYRETCQDKLVDTVPSILKTVKQEALILDLGLLGDHVEVLRMTFKKCETLKMKSIKIRLSSTDPRDQRKATAKVKQKHSPNTFSATVASLLQSMCTRHLRNRTLSVLEIQSVQLSSNAINHLREALLHNKSIKTFSLSGTRIGDCGIKELTVPLRNLISMTSLDLSNCKLSDNARDAVKSIINGHNATRKQLMYADSLRNRVVRPIRGLGLEQIGLSHNMMSDPTCAMFQETLREDTFIQKLILSHNRITPKGAGHLNRLLSINSSISFIDISNNFDERSPIPLKHCSLQFKNFGLGRLMFISNSNSQQCDDLEDVISEDSQLDRIETAVPQTVSSSLDHAGEVGRFDHSVDDNLQCRSSAEDLLCDHPVTTLRELLQMVPGHANSSHVRVDVLEQCVAHDLKRLRVHGVSQLAPIVRKLKSEQKSIVSFDELRTLSNELTLPSATDEAVPRDLVLRMLMTAKHFPDSTQELVHMIKSGTPPLAIHTKLSDLGIGVDGSSPEPTGHVQRYPSTASPPPLQPVSDEAWNSQTPADLRQEVRYLAQKTGDLCQMFNDVRRMLPAVEHAEGQREYIGIDNAAVRDSPNMRTTSANGVANNNNNNNTCEISTPCLRSDLGFQGKSQTHADGHNDSNAKSGGRAPSSSHSAIYSSPGIPNNHLSSSSNNNNGNNGNVSPKAEENALNQEIIHGLEEMLGSDRGELRRAVTEALGISDRR